MTVKYADYIGQTVNAKYAVERNIDGADVPVIRYGEITIYIDSDGDIFLDTEFGGIYPLDDTFELL